ncbi:MAG: hypothetical protein RMK16_05020 [Acidobacteriota bacterium]|nr:hypothetical protein [Acidobacteriota bacterium]
MVGTRVLGVGGLSLWVLGATWLGQVLGHPWVLPVLQTLPVYGFMVWLLRKGAWRSAIRWMWLWAAAVGLVGTLWAYRQGPAVAPLVLYGETYRQKMFDWLRTGQGEESDPRRFLRRHGVELGLFTVTSLTTASLVSMHGGTILMNYMSYYVGSLMRHSDAPFWTFVTAWPVYAVLRVLAYVVLGVLLAEPLLYRLDPDRWGVYRLRDRGPWLALAVVGLVADVFLKAWLAPVYRHWILTYVRLP